MPCDGQVASHFCVECQIGGVWKHWFVTLNFDFLMHVTDCANLCEIEFVVVRRHVPTPKLLGFGVLDTVLGFESRVLGSFGFVLGFGFQFFS